MCGLVGFLLSFRRLQDLERQRAFDRRRAKNAKVPGSMNTVEVLMNRHTLKEAITIARKRQATQR